MRVDNLLAQYSARIPSEQAKANASADSGRTGPSFEQILERTVNQNTELTFSKHAQLRMTQRSMELSPVEMEKLKGAVKKAEAKGVNDTLILMDKMAFIVNVPSNVVVTAMKDEDIQGNVFTKIDGAVVA